MKKICFYHSVDLDGKCSAAIVKKFVHDVELYPFDYGQKFPWDKITSDMTIYLVDISLATEEMYVLNSLVKKLVYIDHHISKLKDLDLSKFEGLQIDGTAACILTWTFFVDKNIPLGVELLGKYDIWDLNDDVLEYQYGIRAQELDPEDTFMWDDYVFKNDKIPSIFKNGKIILKYINMIQKEDVNRTAFNISWKGYNILAMNKTSGSSLLFKDHPDYLCADILMIFGWINGKWKISLYTTKIEIDCSQIAIEYGGGGHRAACGFLCKELPFNLKGE